MQINMAGWQWKHPDSFRIVRPNGIHGMQIILIQSKAVVKMGELEYSVRKNTAFVVESCFPHCLFADGEEYVDDWIRFDLEEGDEAFLKELGIACNVPIPLDSDVVSELIRLCVSLHASESTAKEETIRCLMQAIFQQIKSCYDPKQACQKTHYDAQLDAIRHEIYSSPETDWSITVIAEKLSLSPVHFQRLYKQRYGISCSKDILTSRMELAKQLLVNTDLSAVEISLKCGYADYSHFSRTFQKYACVSPQKYRKDKQN